MSMHHPDMYYDSSAGRSQNTQRHQNQPLQNQASRHFDAFGNSPSTFYPQEEHAVRFDAPRYNDRMAAATLHANYGGYEMGHQTWNGNAFGNNALQGLGGTNRSIKSSNRGRSNLPSGWMDQAPPMPNMPPSYMGLDINHIHGASPVRTDRMGSEPDNDELIPTAIVIKNIPFAVKKEQLVSIMTDLNLPLPYAFNYHFDNGVFRGLAFANFTSADETAAVISQMNHFDLQGRKLRVEYKKMLPAAERERIEREKRERRGQLEEQHRPMPPTLHTQPSMGSLAGRLPANSPSPVSARNVKPDIDLNDPESLQTYSRLLLFKEDPSRDVMVFPSNLTPPQRRQVHTLAHHMGLAHLSKGQADQRAVHVYKEAPHQRLSPPMPQIAGLQNDSSRRALNRAATTDFSDVRDGFYGLRHQTSGYLPAFQDSANNLAAAQNLRGAKSFADLRSYTPSPVPSTASFPASLANNVSRFAEYARDSGAGATPILTPTASNLNGRDEQSLLVNGLGNMNLGNGMGGSPRGLRGMMSWDRSERENPGPIGGHRGFGGSNSFDDQSRPSRQPRGPMTERGTGFSRTRQNGHMHRGSDELSQQSGTFEAAVPE